MSKTIEKLLDFEDKKISIVEVDGISWIPIKPVCEAIGVHYIRQFQNLKDDEILSQLLAEQLIVAADGKTREMICLPEKYVYGWLFSIRSDSADLRVYKMKCYDVLYNYFHGISKAIVTSVTRELEINDRVLELQNRMLESEEYREIQELKKEKSTLNRKRKDMEIKAALGILELEFPDEMKISDN